MKEACEGLVFISETDALIIPFRGPRAEEISPEASASAANVEFREPVEELSAEEFFDRLTVEKEWFGEREKKSALRFRKLHALMEELLTDLKVYRFGKIRIDIVIAGIDRTSRISGIKTQAVET
ncbi:MAG: hypothetical protein IPM50_08900 [Acidobacteriota bacterium]|nr:MAG: hypothetical protein IPM50_08900 [Acidobacteriota bacterium]